MRWLALAFVVAVAALVHGHHRATVEVRFNGDAATYIRPAESLVHAHAFRGANPIANSYAAPGNDRGGPETLRTPGYPLFLAAILALGLPLPAAVVLQHLLAVALAAAVFLFTDVVLRQRIAAIVAGLLIATQPMMTIMAHQYMSDIAGAVFVAAALFCLSRRGLGWTIAAGALAGCTTLVRPIAILWFVPLAVIIAWRTPRRALAFLLASVVLPAAWIARNYEQTGVATISSIAGENMLFFRAGAVLALQDKPLLYRLSAIQQPMGFYLAVDRLKPRLAATAWDEARRDGVDPQRAPHARLATYYNRVGRRIVLQHFPEALELAFSGLVEIFLFTYAAQAAWWVSTGSLLFMLTIAAAAAIFAAACYGIVVLYRREPTLALLFAATIVYFALLPAGGESDSRFAVMFAAPYAIAAGAGIERLIAGRGRGATAAAVPRK